MVRRASSSTNPWSVAVVILLVVAAMVGGWVFYKNVSDPYRTLTPLDVSAYLDSADSLRGNVYKLTGTVATQLAWAPREGRLYSVEVNDRNDILALLIPATFNSLNIQKGQHYFFKIEVGEKGILHVRALRKV
jgi:flagellar basal body-associated protein FliL